MWGSKPDKRLILWRELREQISILTKENAINEVARYWSRAPISRQYLSADLIRDWPDPWLLLNDNHYDDISITLMMVYTLVLSRTDCDDFLIKMMTASSGEEYHTAWIEDGKYIINYEYGDVVAQYDLPDLITRYEYNYTDLKINDYK